MTKTYRRGIAGFTIAAASVGLLATTLAGPANAAPRTTVDQCAAAVGGNGVTADYTVPNDGTNQGCTINGAIALTTKRETSSGSNNKVEGTIVETGGRGDSARYVKVYWIRGKTVIVKKVKLSNSGRFSAKTKLSKKGHWAVVATIGGKAVATTTKVTS